MNDALRSSIRYGPHALSFLVGILAIPLPLTAAVSTYLPLQVGNRWTLASPASKTSMVFEVKGASGTDFTVRWDNPWVKNVSYTFHPSGAQVMLAALDLGRGPMQLPDGIVYFDFDPARPKQWSNLLGQFSIVERALTVETPSGTYRDCIHIRYLSKEKQASDYYFAPGVGFVQLGEGGAAFRLTSFSRGNTAKPVTGHNGDANSTPSRTPGLSRATVAGALLIGLEVNVPGGASQSEYTKWYERAYRAGSRHIQASPIWSDVEKRSGDYHFSSVDAVFKVAAEYSQPIYLNFRVIDTNNLALPRHLNRRSFDDPEVIAAFQKMVQAVAARTTSPGLVKWVSLGNEVDVYLLAHRSSIPAYAKFVRAAAERVRQVFPSAGITVNFTYGALGELRGALLPVAELCDFYSFSYYPLNADFSFRDPSTTAAEIHRMVDFAGGRRVFFQEIGYPSGTRLNSSEQKQAQFLEQMFKVLQQRKDSILGASFVWMCDLDEPTVRQLTGNYHLRNSENFREYLSTLGLFDRQGKPKQAWAVFEREASQLAAR